MDKTGQRYFVVRSTRAADNNNDLDSPAIAGRGRVWEWEGKQTGCHLAEVAL